MIQISDGLILKGPFKLVTDNALGTFIINNKLITVLLPAAVFIKNIIILQQDTSYGCHVCG